MLVVGLPCKVDILFSAVALVHRLLLLVLLTPSFGRAMKRENELCF